MRVLFKRPAAGDGPSVTEVMLLGRALAVREDAVMDLFANLPAPTPGYATAPSGWSR